MPSSFSSSFWCVLHGDGHGTNGRSPFTATHKHVRKRGSGEKFSRRSRGATRGLQPPAQCRTTMRVVCSLQTGEKQTTPTPASAPGLLIPPGMAWESATGTPGEPLQPPWAQTTGCKPVRYFLLILKSNFNELAKRWLTQAVQKHV